MSVILVTGCHWTSFLELEVITRESELLENHRLSILGRNLQVIINVLVCIGDSCRKIGIESILTHPAPVIRPDMDIHIVDVGTRMYPLPKFKTILTTSASLTS